MTNAYCGLGWLVANTLLLSACVSLGGPARHLTARPMDLDAAGAADTFSGIEGSLRPTEVSATLVSDDFDSYQVLARQAIAPVLSCVGNRLAKDPVNAPEVIDVRIPLRNTAGGSASRGFRVIPVTLSATPNVDQRLASCVDQVSREARLTSGDIGDESKKAPYLSIRIKTPARAVYLKEREAAIESARASEREQQRRRAQDELDKPRRQVLEALKGIFRVMPDDIAFARRALAFSVRTGATDREIQANNQTALTLPILFADAKAEAGSRFGPDLVDAYLADGCGRLTPRRLRVPGSEEFQLAECLKVAGLTAERSKLLTFQTELTRVAGPERRAVILHDGAIGTEDAGAPIDLGSCGSAEWRAYSDALEHYCEQRPAGSAKSLCAVVPRFRACDRVRMLPPEGSRTTGANDVFISESNSRGWRVSFSSENGRFSVARIQQTRLDEED